MKTIITFILCLGIFIGIIFLAHISTSQGFYNAVELSAKYKGCVITYKDTRDNKYFLYIKNNNIPYLNDKIEVNDYIYYHVYFVNDTIKQ